MVRRKGKQLQCRKVDNVEEEGNRHFNGVCEGKGFKGGWMYDIQKRIFHFAAKKIPIPIPISIIPNIPAHNNREIFQTTEGGFHSGFVEPVPLA